MIAKALLAALLATLPFLSSAQDAYPSKPVTIIVPYPPAGQADLSARPLASGLQQLLKQPFVVVNRPGAAGAIGNRAVASAAPDGYTLLVTLVSITTIPEVEKLFGRAQSYSMDQFEPLALLVADPSVLVIGADKPWKSVKELVEDAKKHPDDLVFSHSGLYGPSHLPMAMFLNAAGISMRALGAVGGGPTMALVLNGSAAMWASPPAMAVPHVAANKMRTLASFGAKRHPAFPDAPTMKELGYDVEFYVWSGAFAPKGLPPAVLATLRRAIRETVASEEFKGVMAKLKTPIAYLEGDEFRAFLARDAAMLKKAVHAIGKVE